MGWKELGRVTQSWLFRNKNKNEVTFSAVVLNSMSTFCSFHWLWCFFGLLFMQLSCIQHKAVQPVFNPMNAAWSQIREGIDKLETEHAPEEDWRKAGEPKPEVVSSISDLQERAKSLQISVPEREALTAAFNRSSRVIQFGFECDYHALVFFDESGKSWKVIKW